MERNFIEKHVFRLGLISRRPIPCPRIILSNILSVVVSKSVLWGGGRSRASWRHLPKFSHGMEEALGLVMRTLGRKSCDLLMKVACVLSGQGNSPGPRHGLLSVHQLSCILFVVLYSKQIF